MIRTSLSLRSGKIENYHYSKKDTQKTKGRKSFCLAMGEVQKAEDTEHHTITETFSIKKNCQKDLYVHFYASRAF